MFRTFRVLALSSTMLTMAVFAAGQASPNTAAQKPASTTAKSKPAKSAAATHTTLVAAGKLAKFDATSNMLTVTTATGDATFMVAPTVKIQEGSKTLTTTALAAASGQHVRVVYSEKDGMKTVESVHVAAPAPAKPAKTAAKK